LQSIYELEQNDRRNNASRYHNNSRQLSSNEKHLNQEEFKNFDRFNYASIKNYDMQIKQPPVHRPRKVSISVKIPFLLIYISNYIILL